MSRLEALIAARAGVSHPFFSIDVCGWIVACAQGIGIVNDHAELKMRPRTMLGC
jgi:hypothetical protein